MRDLFRPKTRLAIPIDPGPLRLSLEDPLADAGRSALSSLYKSYRRMFHRMLRSFRTVRRGAIRGRRRRPIVNRQAGRNIRVVDYRPGENLLAPLPTVLRAFRDGRARPAQGRIVLRKRDLLGWDKVESESLTLILLVDLSRSTHLYLSALVKILRSLTGHFHRKRDRMGLVSLQGRQARILNHPTHNYRVVTRSLAGLAVAGESPLADGLSKALAMARLERLRNPGSRPLVILVSDCYPEPLTMKVPDLLDEPAFKKAMNAAALYRKEKVHLLVIQPSLQSREAADRPAPAGDRLANAITRLAGGRLVSFAPAGGADIPKERLSVMLGEIEAALEGLPRMARVESRLT